MAEFKVTTDKYKFLDLEDKYTGLNSPTFKISIEGEDIVQSKYMAVSNVSAETSVEAADSCNFTVINAYDYDDETFNWTDKLAVGKKITVEMGYVDKLGTVFEGYITRVGFEFPEMEPPVIRIEGMDASFLLMKGKKTKLWAKKKHSDIVSEIAGNYSLKANVTATSTQYETVIQNNASDYEFLNWLADLNGYEFFITGSNLYFRKLNEAKTEVIELDIGQSVIGFQYGIDLGSQIGGATVKGYTIKEESLVGKGESVDKLGDGQSDGVAEIKKLNSSETIVELYEPVITAQEATDRAKGYLNKAAMKYITGTGTTFGLPEIRAGRHIKVSGMWKTTAKLFYISSARHELDDTGYKTHFDLEGNAI